MTATIKLRDVDNKVISSTSITNKYFYDVDPPTFIDTAWTIADQMATHLSHADEWRLTMTVDLDVRETVEDIIARESKDNG
jgi:hypothetical protein